MTTENTRLLIERLCDSPTALLCNAYDYLGLHAPCTDWSIHCLTPEFPPMVGVALTIKLDCSTPDEDIRYEFDPGDTVQENLWYKLVEKAEQSPLPTIVVIQSTGPFETGAVIGDGMAKTMLAAGAAGFLTNGVVRDLADVKKAGLKTFGGGTVPNHYSLRWSGFLEPVTIGGLTIQTGDVLHGDGDGVIRLPEEGRAILPEACRLVADFEKAAHVLLRQTHLKAFQKEKLVAELSGEYGAQIRALT